jgi:hypothetical protein
MKSPRGAERSQDLGALENAPNKSSQVITTFDLLSAERRRRLTDRTEESIGLLLLCDRTEESVTRFLRFGKVLALLRARNRTAAVVSDRTEASVDDWTEEPIDNQGKQARERSNGGVDRQSRVFRARFLLQLIERTRRSVLCYDKVEREKLGGYRACDGDRSGRFDGG